jgi:hypothetical protein
MEALKNLPIGIQDFEKLRNDGYLYVDKTTLIYRLVTTGSYYFLSRPRRFGKSMLLSTLHAYFSGKKELFEGLAIAELEKDWAKHPVLHLDLNTERYNSAEALSDKLDLAISQWEELYGANPKEKSLATRFEGVIRRACEMSGQRVVILVDEYDKPVLQTIENEGLQYEYRSILKGFYGALKSCDRYIKFALLTGVTKFGKVSVFSDLNNLYDMSMDNEYASICGITDEEIDTTLKPYVQRLADHESRIYEDVREEMRERYDGYHFMENSIAVYNPFSVLNTLQNKRFKSYWFETGTPSYLVYLLQKHNYNLENMSSIEVDEDTLNSVDSTSTNPIPVIYQSGYLTVKDYDKEFGLYQLGFPNKEVEDGFMKFLLPNYTSIDRGQSAFYVANFVKEVKVGKVDEFLHRLSSLFSDTPYDIIKDLENHYQNVIFIVSKLMGFYVKAEYRTSQGRIDLVLQTDDYTYVMEFKLNGTAEEALQQITAKNYTLPFDNGNRKLIKVGINFSSATRNIDRWLIE